MSLYLLGLAYCKYKSKLFILYYTCLAYHLSRAPMTHTPYHRFERESRCGVRCRMRAPVAAPRSVLRRVARVRNRSLQPVAKDLQKVARWENTTSARTPSGRAMLVSLSARSGCNMPVQAVLLCRLIPPVSRLKAICV